jgi:hypothetical protein
MDGGKANTAIDLTSKQHAEIRQTAAIYGLHCSVQIVNFKEIGHIIVVHSASNTMASFLIPLLLVMYILLSLISTFGKDFLIELVSLIIISSDFRHGVYIFFSLCQSANK